MVGRQQIMLSGEEGPEGDLTIECKTIWKQPVLYQC